MIEAIGNYGAHLKPPSYHEIRVTLLKKGTRAHKENVTGTCNGANSIWMLYHVRCMDRLKE